MKLSTISQQGFEVVTLTGPLDLESVAEMKNEFSELTEKAVQGIILDMQGVTFLDSSGVGALVFMYKRLHAEQRTLHLVGLNQQPLKLVRLLRIHQTIQTHSHISDISVLPQVNSAVEG